MAARKRKEDPQASLFGATVPTYASTVARAVDAVTFSDEDELDLAPLPAPAAVTVKLPVPTGPLAGPREVNTIEANGVACVQLVGGDYLVSRVRHDGSSYARVVYSRAELEQLIVCVSEALR